MKTKSFEKFIRDDTEHGLQRNTYREVAGFIIQDKKKTLKGSFGGPSLG